MIVGVLPAKPGPHAGAIHAHLTLEEDTYSINQQNNKCMKQQ